MSDSFAHRLDRRYGPARRDKVNIPGPDRVGQTMPHEADA